MSALEIFRSGKHTDMSGKHLTFTDEQLQDSVDAYDPALFAAPLVVGHPKLNDPAYGWVASLELDNDLVKANPEKVEPQFAEMVNDGRFPKISASFFAPDSPNNPKPGVWYLRHVGFLGAHAPAVKGLKSAQFAEDDDEQIVTVEFAASWVEGGWSLMRVLRNMREWFIATHDTETADRIIPDYLITDITEAARKDSTSLAFADPEDTEEETMDDKKKDSAEFAQRETDLQNRETALEERERKIKDRENQARQDDIASFADSLVEDGKVLPRDREGLVAFMAHLDDDDTVSFAEGDNTVTKPGGTWLRDFLQGLPKQVDFGEHSRADNEQQDSASFAAPQGYSVDSERLAVHNKALAYQAEHKVDYSTALDAVS